MDNFFHSEYFRSLLILISSIILAKIIDALISAIVKRIALRKGTELYSSLVKSVRNPIYLVIILCGAYLSLKTLTKLIPYGTIIDRISFAILVILIALSLTRIINILLANALRVQKQFERTPKLLNTIISVIIYSVALLVILSYFKVEISPLIATLGIGGLAIGLALQSTLSNLIGGIHVVSEKSINIGDFIEIPDANISGFIEDVGWRSTKIRTLPNQIVVIPNSKLADSIIVNNSLPDDEVAVLVQVGVDYRSDLKKVERVTLEVAKEIQQTVNGAVKNFDPFIRFNSFGESNINFTVILRAEKVTDKFFITHEFIKALKERYDKEGIEISWPVRKIYKI